MDGYSFIFRVFQTRWSDRCQRDRLLSKCRKGCCWLQVVEPHSVPSEWLALDLGAGELAALALGLENPDRVVLVDERLARRTYWETLSLPTEAVEYG